MPVTMRDVAQEAGVSIKTVSRVVNKQGEIRDETRKRVLLAIDKLGYRPSKVARALVTNRTDTIGLMIGDISNPYFSEVASGILKTAQNHGYDVFLCNTDGEPEKEKKALYSLLDHNVDGAILYPNFHNLDWLNNFVSVDRPLVLVNCDLQPKLGLGIVKSQIRKGARIATEHLAEKGHQNIAMIAGEVAPKDTIQRVLGYRDGLESRGIGYREELVLTGPPVFEHGIKAAQHFLNNYPEVTALFCYNDLLAMGALSACLDMGKVVPNDCAIVGFDNIRFSSLTCPKLTSVHIDKKRIGQQAARCLLNLLEDPHTILDPIQIDVELIQRDST